MMNLEDNDNIMVSRKPYHCLSSSVPLVQVPYTYLARPAPSGHARPVVRLADGAYLMTRGPATPEHDRHGDLYGGHAPQVSVAL